MIPLAQLIPKSAPGLTILLIDGRWVKLLHAQGRASSRTVTTLLAHPIEGQSDEDVLHWLRQACAARAIEPGTVLVANPSHLTTTRLFTLPATDPREIRDIVELQAEKHTPYAKEEILTDFKVVETDRAGYSRVLLVLSHQDIVHRALKLVEGMGWVLERVGFELEGLVNWARTAQPHAEGATLVVEMDGDVATLLIVHGDQPYFHRSLAMGANQLLQDLAGGPAKLIAELQRSLEAFEAEGLNVPVAAAVLTGQAGRVDGLAAQVQQGLNLPTTVVDPFHGCAIAETAAPGEGDAAQVSFASLAGLTMGRSGVDLTPKALKLHRAFEVRARALVGLGCQLIGGLLLLSCLLIGKAQQHERYHAWLLREYQARLQESQQIERSLQQLELVKEWLHGRGQLLEALADLSEQTPPSILWDSITYIKDGQIILKGVSEDMPKVFDFAAELKKSPTFTKIEARRVANKKKGGEQGTTEFEIVCSFEAPEKAPKASPAGTGG